MFRGKALSAALARYRESGKEGPLLIEVIRKDGERRKLGRVYLAPKDAEDRLMAALEGVGKSNDAYGLGLARAKVLRDFGLLESAQLEFEALPQE